MILMILDSNHSISNFYRFFFQNSFRPTSHAHTLLSLCLPSTHPSAAHPCPFGSCQFLVTSAYQQPQWEQQGMPMLVCDGNMKKNIRIWNANIWDDENMNPQASQSHTWLYQLYHSMLPTTSLSASGWGNRFVACNGGPFVVIFAGVMVWVLSSYRKSCNIPCYISLPNDKPDELNVNHCQSLILFHTFTSRSKVLVQ